MLVLSPSLSTIPVQAAWLLGEAAQSWHIHSPVQESCHCVHLSFFVGHLYWAYLQSFSISYLRVVSTGEIVISVQGRDLLGECARF